MSGDVLERLQRAHSQKEREWIILEFSLATMEQSLRDAVWAGSVPHWFDRDFLSAIVDRPLEKDEFERLTELSFAERAGDDRFSIHDQVRSHLLDRLWGEDRPRYKVLARRAAAYCDCHGHGKRSWQIESIYHLLVAEPAEGVKLLKSLGAALEGPPEYAYETIEVMARLMGEHVSSGRLTGHGCPWVLFWQGHAHKIYGRYQEAESCLLKFGAYATVDALLAAWRARDLADVTFELGKYDVATLNYERALAANAVAGHVLDEAEIRSRIADASRRLAKYRFCQISLWTLGDTEEAMGDFLHSFCRIFDVAESDIRVVYIIRGLSAVTLELPTVALQRLVTALAKRDSASVELGIANVIEVIFEPYHYGRIFAGLSGAFSRDELSEICRERFEVVAEELAHVPPEGHVKEEIVSRLIEVADERQQVAQLLGLIREKNAAVYANHEPYVRAAHQMPVFHQRNASRTNKPKITLRELRGLAWGMATSSVGAFVLTVMELFTLSVAPPIAGIWGLLLIPLGGQVGRAVSEGAFHDHSEKLAIIAVIGLLFGYDLGSGVAYFLMRETSAWQLLIALLFGFFLDVLNMADPFAVLGFAGGGYYAYQTAR